MDGLGFGFHGKTKVFRIADVRKSYTGTLIGNCGYNKTKAEGALETGTVDVIAFGRDYLANPDLVERFKNNWPLAPQPGYETYYTYPENHPEVGYSDFPVYSATKA